MAVIENRPLILRSNRFLGTALLERGLITSEHLEAANEKLLEIIQSGDARGANLLNVLMFELNALDENKLLEEVMDEHRLGAIDLVSYDLKDAPMQGLSVDLCWATFTFPFDKVEDFVMIATAYYMSAPTVKYWEEVFEGKVIWYVSSISAVAAGLERWQTEGHDKEEEKKEE